MLKPNTANINNAFQIGQIGFDVKKGMGSPKDTSDIARMSPYSFFTVYNNAELTVLMAPAIFKKLASDSTKPRDHITDNISSGGVFAPPYLEVSYSTSHSALKVIGHEGWNRTRTFQEFQPHMPIPVRVRFYEVCNTIENILLLSRGIISQKPDINLFVAGPLFKVFFWQNQKWGAFKEDDGSLTARVVLDENPNANTFLNSITSPGF